MNFETGDIASLFAQFIGSAGKHGKSRVVHGNHVLHVEETDRVSGFARIARGLIECAREPHDQSDRAFDLKRQIGEHRAHHRLIVEVPLEHRAIATMLHGLC